MKNQIQRPQLVGSGNPSQEGSRLTIGLLTYGVEDPNNNAIWSGVGDAVREHGANLICFPGKPIRSPVRFNAQANVLYDLVSDETLSGLVIWVGALAHHTSVEEVQAFCEKYRPLPMVSIALLLENIPSIATDWTQMMQGAMIHLVEHHGRSRIAYIRGPKGYPGPEARFNAYLDLLADYRIAYDPSLVVPGFLRESDDPAVA